MKKGIKPVFILAGLLGLLPAVVLAEDTTTRYSRNADRGAWPVNGTAENIGNLYGYGIGGDTRYTETPILHSDLTLLSELKSKAAEESKYIAILYTGWDWCEVGSRLLVEWREGFDNFVTTVYDWPEKNFTGPIMVGETEHMEDLSALSQTTDYGSALYPLGGWMSRSQSWPAIALYDENGYLFAFEKGLEYMDHATLEARMNAMVENYKDYLLLKNLSESVTDAFFTAVAAAADDAALDAILANTTDYTFLPTDADDIALIKSTLQAMGLKTTGAVQQDQGGRTITTNIFKAALLGYAVIELEDNIYCLQHLNNSVMRQMDFNQIKNLDPDGISGALFRINNYDLYGYSGTYLTKVTEELRDSLDGLIDNKHLVKKSPSQYQQFLLCGFNLFNYSKDSTKAEAYARAAASVRPYTVWSEAGRGRLWMMGKGPVTFGFGWKDYHLTASSEVNGYGDGTTNGNFVFDAAEVAEQDGLTIGTDENGTKTFKWVMRYGTDYKIPFQGWYNITMSTSSTTGITLTGIKIYTGTAEKDDYTTGTLVYDGTSGTHKEPTNGDNMTSFTPYTYSSGISVVNGTPHTFTFYMPSDPDWKVPSIYKDWNVERNYNDIAVEITGTFTATCSGSFNVTPVMYHKAQTAPNATEVTIDSEEVAITGAYSKYGAVVADKESAEGANGKVVADEVYAMLAGDTTDEAYITALTRARFFYEYEDVTHTDKVTEVARDDESGVEMLEALLADRTWLTSLMASGPVGTHGPRGGGSRGTAADTLHRLCTLWRVDKIYNKTYPDTRRGDITKAGDDPLLRRMITAAALNAAPWENGNLGQTHWLYRDHMDRSIMHGEWYVQTVSDMRFSYNPMAAHVLDLAHFAKAGHTRIDKIGATMHAMAYRTNNFFGDSIHGAYYYTPWANTMLSGTAVGREVGAVCGGISYHGVILANSTGRRAAPGGQPGHCAAWHRSFDGSMWEIDNNVGRYTGSHFPLWGNSYYQVQEYYDDMWSDPKTLTAYRLMWAAQLREKRYGVTDPGVEALYMKAVEVGPLCYPAILAWRDFLKANYPNDADRWLVWAERVSYALWRYPIVGWPLLNTNVPGPVRATYGDEAVLATMKQLQVRMHDSDRKTREGYNYLSYTVNTQVGIFSEEADILSLLSTTLDARYGTGRFTELVNWGNSRYAAGSTDYNTYQTMLDTVYQDNGNALGVKGTCLESLLAASRDGNVASFREMSALYATLFQTSDYPLASEDELLYTKRLLSADGALTLSSYPTLDKTNADALHESAQAYCHAQRLLDNSAFNTYAAWTQPGYEEPWAMVQMPGDTEVYGIVIQNGTGTGAATLTVEISADGNEWTSLAANRTVGEGETLKVDFDGSQVTRYVRVRRANLSGELMSLRLNKFQVFAVARY